MSQKLCLTGADIVTPFRVIQHGALVIDGALLDQVGRADVVRTPAGCEVIQLPGRKILPGFVDLHIHGVGGHDFDLAGADELDRAAKALLAHGTTSALITLAPAPVEEMLATARRVRAYLDRKDRSPVLCGVHAEGPFLNPEMAGALRGAAFWPADIALAERLLDALGPWLRLMTIAPELPGALDVIRLAARRGVVISVAHSRANYQQIEDAIDCGLTQVTHIFNAMPLAHHRDPGVLGAAYTHQEIKVQLIADGVHVHPAIMKFLIKVKGSGGILLVSDAMPAACLPDGEYEFGQRKVRLAGGVASRADGTLAGSAVALDAAIKTLVERCATPIGDAARMASLNPARVLKMDNRKGILAVGHDADLVVLGPDLRVEMTILGGKIVHPA